MPRENPSWSPSVYLKFERERTLPCRDLVSRIELESPANIVDLGCGPGNSTAVLLRRWPAAHVLGVDNSAEMLESARKTGLAAKWELADIAGWDPREEFDLIFSNALFQWIPDHEGQIPRLFRYLKPGGAFAVQIPSGRGAWVEAIRSVVEAPRWRDRLKGGVDLATEGLDFYYDLLAPVSERVDLWETEYVHVLPSAEAVVEWTKGSALRPLLQKLTEEEKAPFLSDYTSEIAARYLGRPDGKVLFPFLRRFWVAYR